MSDGRVSLDDFNEIPSRATPLDASQLGQLLDAVEVFVRRYVVVEEVQATALVLWVVHTHVIEAAHATPYLFISSAEAESGKTRLMEVLYEIVRAPLLTVNISDAALFRAIDAQQPTLFFDEVDSVFNPKARERGHQADKLALLNAGYRRGQHVLRMGGGNRTTLEQFAVFGPKCLAGLGTLPPTLASRCVPIEMKRRRLTEPVEDFYPEDVAEEAGRLRDALEAWASSAVDTLRRDRPARVEGVRDRTMEVWRPLLAIAELDGEPWSARARRAVITLTAGGSDEPSLGLLLLEDIRAVLEPVTGKPVEVISTAALIRALALAEESPWGEWWLDPRTDDPTRAATRKLAQLLKPYGIRPKVVRIDDATPRGYARTDFLDAWQRFLPPRPSATNATYATSQSQSQANVADVADVAHTREREESRFCDACTTPEHCAETLICVDLERRAELARQEPDDHHSGDDDEPTWGEAHAAASELQRRTGRYGHSTEDVLAEARRMRDEGGPAA